VQHGTAAGLLADDRYAFASSVTAYAPGVLFDDEQNRLETVGRPGCLSPGSQVFDDHIIGGLLAFNCSGSAIPQPELYDIASRSWRSVPLSSSSNPCGPNPICDVTTYVTSAGSRWLQIEQLDCPEGEHCSYNNVFQNIQTGVVAQNPAVPGGHRLANLNAAHLSQRVCSPITIPEGFNIFSAPGPGDLTFEGQFALASSPGPNDTFPTYLEKCGTHLHQLIQSPNGAQGIRPIASSPHAIAWQQTRSTLNVEFLPSRQRFVIDVPFTADPGISQLALTDNRLYVIDGSNKLWISPVPTTPPGTSRR
jgi:hypothetical protein